jgi:malonate decarboxylase beta subunit
MQLITADYPATTPVDTDVHVGVVGSGDLEIALAPPASSDTVTVTVRTSVDGFDTTWRGVLDAFFSRNELACDVRINDFGATPGMVSLRLSQAFEIAAAPDDEATRGTAGMPFTELNARQRAATILDEGTYREILPPSDHVESSHLERQGIVPASDDGAVVARGTMDGVPAAVVALEGKFQGGGIGEVSGAKIAAVLERALVDAENGHPTQVILVLETGGIRLQEANLGLLAIAEIHAGIVALQRHVPVTAIVAGMVGCFGGMGIAAGLCDRIIMTRAGRLSLNGPEVIETEAGIEEFNSADRSTVWAVTGGEHRVATGRADTLVADRPAAVREAVISGWNTPTDRHRADRVDELTRELAATDAERTK